MKKYREAQKAKGKKYQVGDDDEDVPDFKTNRRGQKFWDTHNQKDKKSDPDLDFHGFEVPPETSRGLFNEDYQS